MIFTFGFGHECSCGLSLRNCYVEMEGDWWQARATMVERYGAKWAFQYGTAEEAGVNRYFLRRIVPDEHCGCGGLGRGPWNPEVAGAR